jgi:hypothetical protein
MKKTLASLALSIWVCIGSVAEVSTTGQQENSSKDSQKPPSKRPSSVFKKLEPVLREATTVPLRLPAFLPYVDEEHPIFTNASSVDSSHYQISLGWIPECEGQNVCSYGTVYGGVSPFQSPQEDDARDDDQDRAKLTIEPVEVSVGIKGQFIDAVCYAYCTQSYIRWSEGRFYYAIGIKAERKETLMKVANSAITVGRMTGRKK